MLALVLCLCAVTSILTYAYYVLSQFEQRSPIAGRNILVLTAHPDDECMFFGPTIAALQSGKAAVHVLCLSTGDAEGKGTLRAKELGKSCQVLGLQPKHVKAVHDPDLLDGMTNDWAVAKVENVLRAHVQKHNIDTIVTFDSYGISGHPNHCAAYHGARQFSVVMRNTPDLGDIPIYRLVSIPLARKYIGIVDLLCVSVLGRGKRLLFVAPPGVYLRTHKAMRQHKSQLLWFRWLYVIFSRYMYINELELVQ